MYRGQNLNARGLAIHTQTRTHRACMLKLEEKKLEICTSIFVKHELEQQAHKQQKQSYIRALIIFGSVNRQDKRGAFF